MTHYSGFKNKHSSAETETARISTSFCGSREGKGDQRCQVEAQHHLQGSREGRGEQWCQVEVQPEFIKKYSWLVTIPKTPSSKAEWLRSYG